MSNPEPPVAVVTGAARGIGLATCRRFLEKGMRVAGLDLDAAELDLATSSLDAGARFLPLACDVASKTAVDDAFSAIDHHLGRVDTLVNNAAVVMARSFLSVEAEEFDQVIAVNLRGCFLCCQRAVALIPETGGRIINLSSHSGSLGSLDRAAYAASKGGIDALTRVMAVELAERGITVNAVAPGPVETPHTRVNHSQERRSAWADALPLRRYGTSDEIVGLISFLASPDAAYITGQVIAVDGGFTAAGLIATH